jgi:hypothetical protein
MDDLLNCRAMELLCRQCARSFLWTPRWSDELITDVAFGVHDHGPFEGSYFFGS